MFPCNTENRLSHLGIVAGSSQGENYGTLEFENKFPKSSRVDIVTLTFQIFLHFGRFTKITHNFSNISPKNDQRSENHHLFPRDYRFGKFFNDDFSKVFTFSFLYPEIHS